MAKRKRIGDRAMEKWDKFLRKHSDDPKLTKEVEKLIELHVDWVKAIAIQTAKDAQ